MSALTSGDFVSCAVTLPASGQMKPQKRARMGKTMLWKYDKIEAVKGGDLYEQQ